MNELKAFALLYEDTQRNRIRQENRFGEEMDETLLESLMAAEKQAQKMLVKAFKRHPAYEFCSNVSGLGGPLGALLVAYIDDPRRFPGQQCTEGHYSPACYKVGDQCPEFIWMDKDDSREQEQCTGRMLKPREGSGVRAFWRYCGMDVTDEGKSPRKRKGVQSHWNPAIRRLIDMPGTGIKAQIVKHRPEPYRTIYDNKKADKLAKPNPATGEPYKLGHADRIAQTTAVKALLGDLLVEWKATYKTRR